MKFRTLKFRPLNFRTLKFRRFRHRDCRTVESENHYFVAAGISDNGPTVGMERSGDDPVEEVVISAASVAVDGFANINPLDGREWAIEFDDPHAGAVADDRGCACVG